MWKMFFYLLLIIILAGSFVFPIYWMVIGSFTEGAHSLKMPPDFYPRKPNLSNYFALFREFPVTRWMLNSLIVASSVTFISVSTSCLAGYAFAKKSFIGKNVLFWLIMSTLMIPFYSIMIPLFITVRNLGLFNTYPGIFLPMACYATNIFLARQYMSTLPSELIDAAKIDGASELRVFTYLILPLSKPLIAAITIFTFVYGWKTFMWPLIVTSNMCMRTLPVAIATAVSYPDGHVDFGVAMAGTTMVVLPTLIVFALFQKYFIKGITVGGVKG